LRIAGVVSQRLNGSTMDVVVEEALEGTRMGIGIMPMPGPEPLTDDSWARAPRSTSHPGLQPKWARKRLLTWGMRCSL
jgi:hypothetical protein